MWALVSAHAEKRVALVVGNSNYTNISRLRNPANDARLVADTLRGLGFALVGNGPQINLDKAGLDRAVQSFGAQLQSADVGLFYYAGHGIQLRGANYLVPVDANVTREADAEFQMLNVNRVLEQVDPADGPGGRLNVVILDACRNNPFGSRLRSADRGLGVMQAPGGTLISFATQPGAAAQDGDGDHSPFSVALADSIRRPGLGLFDVFNEIGLSVKRATGGTQQPWVSSSPIAGQFYFAGLPPGKETPPVGGAVSDADRAAQAWGVIQTTTNFAVLDEYIRQYGNVPIYGALARARREELVKQQTAAVAPPVVPAHSFSETFADDLAQVLKGGDNLRVATAGAVPSLEDLLYQRGVDVAITQSDVFEFFRTQRKAPNLENRVQYIVRLPASQLHVVAPADVRTLDDLRGKKVNFGKPGTDSSLTAQIVFLRLVSHPLLFQPGVGVAVEATSFDDELAMQKLRSGDIAAAVLLANKPIDHLAQLPANSGLHLVPIPFTKQFEDFYVLGEFRPQDYPTLVPPGTVIDTIAVPQVLAVFNWPKGSDRYRKVQRFVQGFFNKFEQLQMPPRHPEWRNVNLAATVPGWTRWSVAEEMVGRLR
jgi:hypothetical protein